MESNNGYEPNDTNQTNPNQNEKEEPKYQAPQYQYTPSSANTNNTNSYDNNSSGTDIDSSHNTTPYYNNETNYSGENDYNNQPVSKNESSLSNYNNHQQVGPRTPDYNNTSNYEEYHTQQDNYYNNTPPSEPKKKKGTAKKWISIISAAAVFGLVAGVIFQGVNFIANYNKVDISSTDLEQTPVEDTSKKIATTTVNQNRYITSTDVVEVVENTMPSIVSITSLVNTSYNFFGREYENEGEGSGSGFIVGKNEDELLIATNNHVVQGATKIQVSFIDDEVVEAVVKGVDSISDLAVISVKLSDMKKSTLSEIKIATLGESDDIKVGQMAVAIGNALGYGQTVTVGYISAKERDVTVERNTMKLLQTDAAINPGNSGGPLLNISGEVIGINSAKYADSVIEGMGFAIPISKATPIINELMNREELKDSEKGYLGVTIEDVTREENQKYGMPIGVYITSVSNNGAAKEAGIVPGDIIIKVNGMETASKQSLVEKINSYRKGTEITITVSRYNNGIYKEQDIKVTLKGEDTLEGLDSSSGNDTQIEEEEKDNSSKKLPDQKNDSSNEDDSYYYNDQDDFFNDFFNDFFQ